MLNLKKVNNGYIIESYIITDKDFSYEEPTRNVFYTWDEVSKFVSEYKFAEVTN